MSSPLDIDKSMAQLYFMFDLIEKKKEKEED
jgi:hypothetical protein